MSCAKHKKDPKDPYKQAQVQMKAANLARQREDFLIEEQYRSVQDWHILIGEKRKPTDFTPLL
jgi:type II secretory pathway component PulL